MDVIEKIDKLMQEHGWSDYKLAQESGLSSSTIANIHRRNTVPSISTLQSICDAFGISMAQFFSEDNNFVYLTPEQQEFFNKWLQLTNEQKQLLYSLLAEFR